MSEEESTPLPRELHQLPLRQSRATTLATKALKWCFEPHTLVVIVLVSALLTWTGFLRDSEDTVANVKAGIVAACGVFIVTMMLHTNLDSFFTRPHPAIWRAVRGLAILYLMFLIFLLHQYIYSDLGKPLEEFEYAKDCRIYTPDNPESNFYGIKNVIFDRFFLAHFFGWLLKYLLFRDVYMCMVLSVWFEFLEYAFQHILLNFQECWWDRYIIDIMVTNSVGIILGYYTARFFNAMEYNWMLALQDKNTSLWQRFLIHFTPNGWKSFEWNFLSSPRKYFGFIGFIIVFSFVELNCFFLKYNLWHPPTHGIVGWRLLLWWFICFPASREIYFYVADEKQKKLRSFAWLGIALVVAECGVELKFSKGQYPHLHSHPIHIVLIWIAILLVVVLTPFFYFYVFECHKKKRKSDGAGISKKESENQSEKNGEENVEEKEEENKKDK